MNYLSISFIILFYIFFFLRAFLLSKNLGKNIKANNTALNIAIISAALASISFLVQNIYPAIEKYLLKISHNQVLEIIGTIFILLGLVGSSIASLHLGKSWRIGIDKNEKTALITKGFYRLSRNPYFLSYDLVLIGISLSSQTMVVLSLSIITITLFHILILKEEKFLESVHSDEYRNYKKDTRRYI